MISNVLDDEDVTPNIAQTITQTPKEDSNDHQVDSPF